MKSIAKEKVAKPVKKFLIVLSTYGDTHIVLANAAVGKWINRAPKSGYSWRETIPKGVLAGYEDRITCSKVSVSCLSYDNDRAIACPGEPFNSITNALAYCREHNLEIVGDYIGGIY